MQLINFFGFCFGISFFVERSCKMTSKLQPLIDQLQEDVKLVRPSVEKTRQNQTKNPDVDRLEEDVNRLGKRWEGCCMQVVERLQSCEAALELLEKYQVSYQRETNWMDELDSKLKNLEELEAARAKEAWEKHVVSFISHFTIYKKRHCVASPDIKKKRINFVVLKKVAKLRAGATFVI